MDTEEKFRGFDFGANDSWRLYEQNIEWPPEISGEEQRRQLELKKRKWFHRNIDSGITVEAAQSPKPSPSSSTSASNLHEEPNNYSAPSMNSNSPQIPRMPTVESPRAHERDSSSSSPIAVASERALILLNFLVVLFTMLFFVTRFLSIISGGGWDRWFYQKALSLATYSYLLSIFLHVRRIWPRQYDQENLQLFGMKMATDTNASFVLFFSPLSSLSLIIDIAVLPVAIFATYNLIPLVTQLSAELKHQGAAAFPIPVEVLTRALYQARDTASPFATICEAVTLAIVLIDTVFGSQELGLFQVLVMGWALSNQPMTRRLFVKAKRKFGLNF